MRFIRDMSLIEWLIIAAIVLILAALMLGAPARKKEQDEFMAACMTDRKQYECQALWKQMHPDPIVVYAPLNR